MRNLSSTLLKAQQSASARPYVKVEVAERVGGIARLRWQRWYAGTEAEGHHSACIYSAPLPRILRIWSDPVDNTLYYNVQALSEHSDYSHWNPVGMHAYANACCGRGCRLLAVAINTADGAIYWADEGFASIYPLASVGGDPSYRLAIAMKDDDSAVCAYSDNADVYAAHWTRQGGWGSFTKWTNPSLNAITGLALTYNGDYNAIITGIDPDGRRGVWSCVYGDGYSAATGVWTGPVEQATAEADSDVSFHFPSLDRPDVFRLFYVERREADESYNRPYWTYSLTGADFISNLWREPVAFNPSGSHGLAMCHLDSQVFLSRPDGVWCAPLTPAAVDISQDVVEIQATNKPFSGGVAVTLRNDDGQYNRIGAGACAAIQKGSEVRLSFGYHTPSGAEDAGLEPVAWIDGWEHLTRGRSSEVILYGRNGWSLLDTWRARRQFTWAQGEKNVFQLLRFVFSRAGLTLSALSTSDVAVNHYPAFTIHPHERGSTAVSRLLDMVPDVILFVGDSPYVKNPASDEASVYAYGVAHPILEGRYGHNALDINHVQVYGDEVVTEDWDWNEIALVYDRLAQASDLNLNTAEKAHQRGEAVLTAIRREASGGRVTAPMNCGQDLFDVIAVDSPQASLNASKRRVVSLIKVWIPKQAKYAVAMGLEAV